MRATSPYVASGFSRTLSVLAAGALAIGVSAQAPATPAFDVESVKENKSGDSSSSTRSLPGNGFSGTNVTLRQLIVTAYRLRPFQVTGGPGWLDSDRFDINARASENTPPGQMLTMLRAMLADRFKLKVHTETREQPIYALVLARRDGQPGPGLKPTTLDCNPRPPAAAGAAPASPPMSLSCGTNTNTTATSGKMTGGGRTMEEVAAALANRVAERMVVDRTGLTGRYDFELQWTPDSARGVPADAGSLFTALQEQLGLKLEAQRGPVEFLVIDSAERPTPD